VTIVDRSTIPLVDCNFSLLPVHFPVDPAVDDVTVTPSYERQMSLSQQVDLMANYLDIRRIPVIRATTSSPPDLLDPGGMRPRTASWGGSDRQTSTTDDSQAADADRKKAKSNFKVTKKLGQLGQVVSKKLKPGGKREEVVNDELRRRRKASVGRATQNTRLSCITDEMLMDHTQVNSRVYVCLCYLPLI